MITPNTIICHGDTHTLKDREVDIDEVTKLHESRLMEKRQQTSAEMEERFLSETARIHSITLLIDDNLHQLRFA